ncbi:sigma-G-dependent sporulation-specific acid-soluble spore protein CsgA [Mesobacillus harenae]|uniref:sigma-G-dependent sporulation-specific acid-soluble spore protein CsgA n=1 Tax=Mesobacillus harenae TaxID=2213203 RepID=UPI00157FD6F6|nr:sigma-G-dependent sporulation-specific acid-soluble spore protein CsgA [Mesobacillus harenae]
MDHTLGYLREILANYTEVHPKSKDIYNKIEHYDFKSEGAFVRILDETEIQFLNKILPDEINHAKEAQDDKRADELNEVYELLF